MRRAIFATPACDNPVASATTRRLTPAATAARMALSRRSAPKAPPGFSNCQTGKGVGRDQRINHLVRYGPNGGTPGRTVCGLTRFDSTPGAGDADLPGWSMHGGGISGPGITQVLCAECWGSR